jgi:hypothetical protein
MAASQRTEPVELAGDAGVEELRELLLERLDACSPDQLRHDIAVIASRAYDDVSAETEILFWATLSAYALAKAAD